MAPDAPVFLSPAAWHALLLPLGAGQALNIRATMEGLCFYTASCVEVVLPCPAAPMLQICALWGLLDPHASCTTRHESSYGTMHGMCSWHRFMHLCTTQSFRALTFPGLNLAFTTNPHFPGTSFVCASITPHSHHAQLQRATLLRPLQGMEAFPEDIIARVRARHPQLG